MANFKYPVGEGIWESPSNFDYIITKFNNGTYETCAIVECDLSYPDKKWRPNLTQ